MKALTRTALIAFWFMVSLTTRDSMGQQPTHDLGSQVQSMLAEFKASANPREWPNSNTQRFSLALASAAVQLHDKGMQEGRIREASEYAAFAGIVYLHLSHPGDALEQFIDSKLALFIQADTVEECERIRSDVLELRKKADSIQRLDLGFAAATLIADCTSCETNDNSPEKVKRLLLDVADAARRANKGYGLKWLEPLAGLITNLVQKVQIAFPDSVNPDSPNYPDQEISPVMSALTLKTERLFPPEFRYQGSDRDTAYRTIETTRKLAFLSYVFGDRPTGSARLTEAHHVAHEIADPQQALEIIEFQYRAERETGTSRIARIPLRSEARADARQVRSLYHSRAGRVWASYMLDEGLGGMLADEVFEPATKNNEDIFASIEQLKARTLSDDVLSHFVDLPAKKAKEAASLEELAIGFSGPTKPTTNMLRSELRLISQLSGFTDLQDSEKRIAALKKLEALYAETGAGSLRSAEPIDLKAVQYMLQPREALLEFVIPSSRPRGVAVCFVTKDRFEFLYTPGKKLPFEGTDVDQVMAKEIDDASGKIEVDLTGGEGVAFITVDGGAPVEGGMLNQGVIALRTAIRSKDEKRAHSLLGLFYDVLIRPLERIKFRPEDYDRLIIVPHGVLHYIPFAALINPRGEFLIQKTAVTVAPSASVWHELAKRSGPIRSFVAFTAPDFKSAEIEKLQCSAKETNDAADVLQLADKTIYPGERATKEMFVRNAPRGSLLHVSTHGFSPEKDALNMHGLQLTPLQGSDGILRASEIRELDLSGTRLAVLSVCDSGLYRIGPGDEPYGLVPALLTAGVENVVATLWEVKEEFACEFIPEFYRQVLQKGPSRALQLTCIKFINGGESIREWAAFTVVGPGRPFGTETVSQRP